MFARLHTRARARWQEYVPVPVARPTDGNLWWQGAHAEPDVDVVRRVCACPRVREFPCPWPCVRGRVCVCVWVCVYARALIPVPVVVGCVCVCVCVCVYARA